MSQTSNCDSSDFAPEELLTKQQVGKVVKLSTRSIDRLIVGGRFPAGLKVGSHPRWKRSTINRFINTLQTA